MKFIQYSALAIFGLIAAAAIYNFQINEPAQCVQERPYNYDGPGQFAAMHDLIRRSADESIPGYKQGYKLQALKSAKHSATKADDLNWIDRGPGNVGGRTRGLIVDPTDETNHTWFAASVGGGVWKTEDAGRNWRLLTPDLPNLATSTIAMSESNPDVIYVGTGEGFPNFESLSGSGMWKSEDHGETWTALASTSSDNRFLAVLRIIVNPTDENELLVAIANPSDTYILKSTDGGETWQEKLNESFTAIQQIVYAPNNWNTQYATVNGVGVIKSLDAGETWTQVFDANPFEFERMELAVSPNDENVVYLSCQAPFASDLIFTRDGFETFDRAVFDQIQADWLGAQGWYGNTIAVHPFNDSLVWVAGQLTMLELKPTNEDGEVTLFAEFVNNTDFLVSIDDNQFSEESGGESRELFSGLPVPLETTQADIIDVEIIFGPGISSKAHLVDVNLAMFAFNYNSMIEVPFQAWDIVNNRQLAMSVFDVDGDGEWTFEDYTDAVDPFYDAVFVNILDYSETAHPVIAAGNAVYKSQYYFFLGRSSDYVGTTADFPTSSLEFNTRQAQGKRTNYIPITDPNFQYTDIVAVGSKGVHVDHHNIILIPNDSVDQSFYVLNANDGGVAFSEDSGVNFVQTGATFDIGSETLKGYNVSQFYGIDKMNGANRYIGGTQDNGTWVSDDDPGSDSDWVPAPSGDGFEAAWNYDDTNLILETSQFNNLFKSYNGGVSWENISLPGGEGPFLTRLASSQVVPNLIFMVAEDGLLRSVDFGENWEVITMPENWSFQSLWGPVVRISLADPNVVWSGWRIRQNERIAVSSDQGLTFSETGNYNTALTSIVVNIATHPSDANTAYAIFAGPNSPKILKTENLGVDWVDISGFNAGNESVNGFPDVMTFDLLVMPWDTDRMWAGTEIGIFESLDGGESWAFADNGFPAASVWQMKIVNDEIIIATHGRGVWTVNTNELMDVGTSEVLPVDVIDFDIYPNPIYTRGKLTLDLKDASFVNVSIYNIQGQLLQTVVNEKKTIGTHNFVIETSQLMTGIYQVVLTTANGRVAKELVVL